MTAIRSHSIVEQMLAQDPFSRWLGVDIARLEEGRVELTMKVRAEMLNGFGRCHGGILFSFADSSLAFSSNSPGRIAVSVDNSIAYSRPVHAGDVLSTRVEEIRRGHNISLYSIRICNQRDETVALFRGTVYRTSREHAPGALQK